ncbi:MAG TPA: SAM-dependent methyltransferase [Thermoanaerobaculia bacterium]
MPRSLAERLRDRIRREGPISFADFMEAALYDPDSGYYARGAPIGEGGDFVTSSSISPAFAAAIARRFAKDAEMLEGDLDFVEIGAGDGTFLAGFGEALARDHPAVASRTRLTAVERGTSARENLAKRPLSVLTDPAELPERSVVGWIFANELYDALPVARVRGTEEGLEELSVDVEDDRFVWTASAAPAGWSDRLARSGVSLAPGQIGEIRPGAAELHRALARALSRGRIVVFDYGHRARTLYHPLARPGGTLAVHRGGRRGGDPLERPGEQDLTAHVDWDELVSAGEDEGLRSEGPIRQGRFLAESGIFDFARTQAEKWRAYRLVDPTGMGEEISVLVQSRGIDRGV